MKKGFTLIELVIALGILLVVGALAISALTAGREENGTVDPQQDAQETCKEADGIPILDSWDRMTDCIFKPGATL